MRSSEVSREEGDPPSLGATARQAGAGGWRTGVNTRTSVPRPINIDDFLRLPVPRPVPFLGRCTTWGPAHRTQAEPRIRNPKEQTREEREAGLQESLVAEGFRAEKWGRADFVVGYEQIGPCLTEVRGCSAVLGGVLRSGLNGLFNRGASQRSTRPIKPSTSCALM